MNTAQDRWDRKAPEHVKPLDLARYEKNGLQTLCVIRYRAESELIDGTKPVDECLRIDTVVAFTPLYRRRFDSMLIPESIQKTYY